MAAGVGRSDDATLRPFSRVVTCSEAVPERRGGQGAEAVHQSKRARAQGAGEVARGREELTCVSVAPLKSGAGQGMSIGSASVSPVG